MLLDSSLPRKPEPVENPNGHEPTVVTECWVEGCCFEQTLLPIDKHLVFRPLPAAMPVPGTAGMSIHLSGLSTESSTYLRRLVRVIGATQAVSLNKQTTHLVSGKSEGPKVDKAREWGLSVVSEGWLLAIGRLGTVVPVTDYPLDSNTSAVTDIDADAGPGESVTVSQGHGRELKPTPTHIDRARTITPVQPPLGVTASGPAAFGTPSTGSHNPLSPPHGESARKLNHASTSAIPLPVPSVSPSDAGSGKLSRAGSAVPGGSNSNTTSTSGKDVTDVLRQLAERGDTTPIHRVKAVSIQSISIRMQLEHSIHPHIRGAWTQGLIQSTSHGDQRTVPSDPAHPSHNNDP